MKNEGEKLVSTYNDVIELENKIQANNGRILNSFEYKIQKTEIEEIFNVVKYYKKSFDESDCAIVSAHYMVNNYSENVKVISQSINKWEKVKLIGE